MLVQRLTEARKEVGLSQFDVAMKLDCDRTLITHVESNRVGLSADKWVRVAHMLGVSVDYLAGLTDDPAPVDDRVREEERKREELEAVLQSRDQELDRLRAQAAATAGLPDPDVSPIQSAPGWHDEDFESVRRYESEDVRLAAGTGTFADQEPVAGEVKFRTSWLRKRRLRAKDVFLVDVLGDSMERTIFDGDAALVNETHTSPRSGKIYALRTEEGPLVKRLRKRDHRWWADSDNEEHEPQPLDDVARIMGRVVWWAHTDR